MKKRVFEITYGSNHARRGYVYAGSHDEVKEYLRMIGWPTLSQIIEVPVMKLMELQSHQRRLELERKGGQ